MAPEPPAKGPERLPIRRDPSHQSPRPHFSSEGAATQRKAPVFKPRLVIIQSVYLQHPNSEPTVAEARTARFLDSEEQAWVRLKVTVGNDWEKVDGGWIEQTSAMVIKCLEGELTYGVFFSGQVVAVSPIPAGFPLLLIPTQLSAARIKGPGKYSLTLMPE